MGNYSVFIQHQRNVCHHWGGLAHCVPADLSRGLGHTLGGPAGPVSHYPSWLFNNWSFFEKKKNQTQLKRMTAHVT